MALALWHRLLSLRFLGAHSGSLAIMLRDWQIGSRLAEWQRCKGFPGLLARLLLKVAGRSRLMLKINKEILNTLPPLP
jgi:hypothetical protein